MQRFCVLGECLLLGCECVLLGCECVLFLVGLLLEIFYLELELLEDWVILLLLLGLG